MLKPTVSLFCFSVMLTGCGKARSLKAGVEFPPNKKQESLMTPMGKSLIGYWVSASGCQEQEIDNPRSDKVRFEARFYNWTSRKDDPNSWDLSLGDVEYARACQAGNETSMLPNITYYRIVGNQLEHAPNRFTPFTPVVFEVLSEDIINLMGRRMVRVSRDPVLGQR